MTISAHHKIDKFLFSTVVPKLYKIELGENGNTICKVDTLGFIPGFTSILSEAYRTTIESMLMSDFVIHLGIVSEKI
jgi:50S ribosomal subunit-associated GTPase HflX